MTLLLSALAAYAAAVLLLVIAGRGEQARALAGFVPDCAVLFARLMRDPAVPRRRKALVGLVAAYLASPIDLAGGCAAPGRHRACAGAPQG